MMYDRKGRAEEEGGGRAAEVGDEEGQRGEAGRLGGGVFSRRGVLAGCLARSVSDSSHCQGFICQSNHV